MPASQSRTFGPFSSEIHLFLRNVGNGKYTGRFVSPSEANQYLTNAELVHVKIDQNQTITLSIEANGSVKMEKGHGQSSPPVRQVPFDNLVKGSKGKLIVPFAGTTICVWQGCNPETRVCLPGLPFPNCDNGTLKCTDDEPPG